MVSKSFPRKQVTIKHFQHNFLVEMFYGCKIISSKTDSYKKFSKKIFGRKFFMVAKLFPGKQVITKHFQQIVFGRKFLKRIY